MEEENLIGRIASSLFLSTLQGNCMQSSDYKVNCTTHFIQVSVEVLGIIFDEEERGAAVAGDNVKLKLRGVEEEVNL